MNHSTQSSPAGSPPPRSTHSVLPAALVLSLGLIATSAIAQPGGPGGPPPNNSFALDELAASYSLSADADIELNGKLGTAEITHFDFEASFALPAPDTWRLSSSIAWTRDEFELTGTVPLPEDLESLGFTLMAMKDLAKEFGAGWSGMAMLNPAFYSDSGEISGDSFYFTGFMMFTKTVSPNFQWSLGVIGMSRGDMNVFPMLGLRWNFATDWSLLLGFPRTGVSYRATEKLTLTAGLMGLQGGTYYISKAPAPGFGDTYLDYQEARGGLRVEYEFSRNFVVEADAGVTLNRQFDYYDLDYKLEGDSSGYGRIGLKYRF